MNSVNTIITVLMPVYNGEKFLSETIKSILSQTYKDFEFLIIDDCSTDNSIKIINSYNDDRIKLVKSLKNRGQSMTMNEGLKLAKGKYIARIDQDDISYKNRLQTQIDKIHGIKKTILGTWAYAINEKSEIIGCIEHPINNELIIDGLSLGSSISHSSIFAEKKDLVSLGGYSKKFKIAMDWDLWIKAATNDIYFYNIPEYLIGLRQHSYQTSRISKYKGNKILNIETLELLNKSKKLIKSKKNLKAYNGWKFYYQITNIKLHSNSVMAFIKIIYYLLRVKNLMNFLKLVFYHKIVNDPTKLYNPPILYKKLSSSFFSN